MEATPCFLPHLQTLGTYSHYEHRLWSHPCLDSCPSQLGDLRDWLTWTSSLLCVKNHTHTLRTGHSWSPRKNPFLLSRPKKIQFCSETHFYPSSNEIQGKTIACWTYTWIPIYLSIHIYSQNTLICMQVIYVIYDIYCDIVVLCNIYAGLCLPIYHHKKFPNMSTIFYFTLMRPILPQFFKCIYDLPHAKPCAMCQEYEVE